MKSALVHGKWYLASSIISKGINILLLPVYTRYLSPNDYGLLSSLISISQILPLFISLSLDAAFARFFHDAKHSQEDLKLLFSTVYWFVIACGSLVIGVSIATSYLWLPNLLKVPVWPYAWLAFIPTLFGQVGQLGIVFLRQSLMAKQTSALEISTTVIGALVTLPLLMVFNLGVIARLWGMFVPGLLLGLFYTVYFWKHGLLCPLFNRKVLRNCLGYSLPCLPAALGSWIAGQSDRLVLSKYANLEAVGLFSLAAQFGYIIYILQDAVTQVQGPISMSGLVYDKKNTKERLARFLVALLAFLLLCHLSLTLFSREIIMLFTDKRYFGAYKLVGIMGFVYVIGGMYRVFTDIIAFHKKMAVISLSVIVMGMVSLGCNLLFVPRFGYYASAAAAVLSMLTYFLLIFFFSQSIDKLQLAWAKLGVVFVIYLVALFTGLAFLMERITLFAFLAKSCVIVCVSVAYLKIALSQDQQYMLKEKFICSYTAWTKPIQKLSGK